ncbi:hypothetical protein ZHAS_00015975 [Anopheles sinensis]|uniref:Transmembrane protein n=1 Tax=Anopheles sinensis TaxID=74873 RepID=A0A084WCH2_ANOSI|nr:hypothetical protein ZHAS_00015975 [Anopheles sinensis]
MIGRGVGGGGLKQNPSNNENNEKVKGIAQCLGLIEKQSQTGEGCCQKEVSVGSGVYSQKQIVCKPSMIIIIINIFFFVLFFFTRLRWVAAEKQ